MTGEQTEIAALREILRTRTAALEAIAKGPRTDDDSEFFGQQAQALAQAALVGESE